MYHLNKERFFPGLFSGDFFQFAKLERLQNFSLKRFSNFVSKSLKLSMTFERLENDKGREKKSLNFISLLKIGRSGSETTAPDVDEQRKIAEGADALLNLAGVSTVQSQNNTRTHPHPQEATPSSPAKPPPTQKSKRRSTSNDYSSLPDKRRRRWREWGEGNRYLKQVRG